MRRPGVGDPPLAPYHDLRTLVRRRPARPRRDGVHPAAVPRAPCAVAADAVGAGAAARHRRGVDLLAVAGADAAHTVNHPANPCCGGWPAGCGPPSGSARRCPTPAGCCSGRCSPRSVPTCWPPTGLEGPGREDWVLHGRTVPDAEVAEEHLRWYAAPPRRGGRRAAAARRGARGAGARVRTRHLVVGPAAHGVTRHALAVCRAGGFETVRRGPARGSGRPGRAARAAAGGAPGAPARHRPAARRGARAGRGDGGPARRAPGAQRHPARPAPALRRTGQPAPAQRRLRRDRPGLRAGGGRQPARGRAAGPRPRTTVGCGGRAAAGRGRHADRRRTRPRGGPLPVGRATSACSAGCTRARATSRRWPRWPGCPRRGAAGARRPSPGHEELVDDAAGRARAVGRRFTRHRLGARRRPGRHLRAVAVPVAAHQHVSASGSVGSWLSAGRRPLVPAPPGPTSSRRGCPAR